MIKFQLVSSVSGRWDVYPTPLGWSAQHEDIDGAEDSGDYRFVSAKLLDDLVAEIKQWDEEIDK